MACAALLVPSGGLAAEARNWPQKPIRWIVNSPAGGISDVMARVVAPRWGEALGQPLVVDPRPGGGGMLAYGLGARAAPDGYTVSFASAPFVVLVSLHAKPQYRLADYVPVGPVATAPNVLVASPRVPGRGVKDLVAWLRAREGAANLASVGVGSTPHLSGEMFNRMAGVRATHVPYNGSTAALNELMAGRVDYLFVNYPAAAPLARAGKLAMVATGSAQRLPSLPDVPTLSESGFPGFLSVGFYGVMAPAAIPRPILATLSRELSRTVQHPEVRERLGALGADPATAAETEGFAAFLAEEARRWATVIREAGVRVDH
jgi:tripartite-type tricarboxylate transporter receptor subunit TctC